MSINAWSGRSRALNPATPEPGPRLTLVSRPGLQAPRLPFVLFVMVLLASGLIGLLLLNTSLQRGAYTASGLRQESNALEVRRELLQTKVGALQDPQRVAQQALHLGMVQNDSPAFLMLASGTIIGKPLAANATNQVDIDLGTSGGVAGNVKVRGPFAGAGAGLSTPLVSVAEPERAQTSEKPRPDEGKPRV